MLFKKTSIEISDQGVHKNPTHPSCEISYLQFPNLSRHKDLFHAVYTRHGGVSSPPFQSLNTGFSTGDHPEKVDQNLTVIKTLSKAGHLYTMHQVHGNNVIVLRPDDGHDLDRPLEGDAMMTNLKHAALMVRQADCQAVILFDPVKKVIANAHCGWRGNTKNILGTVVDRMKSDFGCRASHVLAAIGPSLGPCCAEFVTHREIFPDYFRSFMVAPDYFNLWQISRYQLLQSGLRERNIEIAGICTRCRTDLFFSYRAEGTTGRFATLVMIR